MITKLCMGCGRLTEYEILCIGCQNIVYNLRIQYKDLITHIKDAELAKVFDEWNVSDKSIDFLEWLE